MITKISEIAVEDIQSYLRISEMEPKDKIYLSTILKSAINFIKNYTGLEENELDLYSDLVAVVYVLCQDMYDNRSYYVDSSNVNKVIQTILDMHSRNLLWVNQLMPVSMIN